MVTSPARKLMLAAGALLTSAGLAAAEDNGTVPPTFSSALEASIQLRGDVERFNEQIAARELASGPYDRGLVEPLWGLYEILVQLRAYDEADASLNRLLMLLRTLDGPASLEQVPVLREAIRNDIRRRDWDAVTQRYEFMQYLYSQVQDSEPEMHLAARDELIRWHLSALYLDDPADRLRHFTEAMELQRQNLNLATDTFGENSPELVPWLYKSAVLKYRVYAILSAEDELGLDARRAIIGGVYLEEQLTQIDLFIRSGLPTRGPRNYLEDERNRTLLEALALVRQIREIVAAEGDAEAEAMAAVYEADFQVLLDRGSAARTYREAMDLLATAGQPEHRIDDFFSHPSVLPEEEFHPRLEAALTARETRGFVAADGEQPAHLGTYQAWNESLASAQRPELPAAALTVTEELALAEFELRFRVNSRGETRNRKVIDSSVDSGRLRSDARDALENLRFRPVIENGRGVTSDELRIHYTIPRKP